MNVKEAEVYQEGQDNEAHRTSAEMLDKHAHGQTASDIQQIPQIQDDGTANVANVSTPTILHEIVHARLTPVRESHVHQAALKGL